MHPVALNARELWAYAVEMGDRLRMRFDLDESQRLNLRPGSADRHASRGRTTCGCPWRTCLNCCPLCG